MDELQKIEEKTKKRKKIVIGIIAGLSAAALAFVAFLLLSGADGSEKRLVEGWPDMELLEGIPVPESEKGCVTSSFTPYHTRIGIEDMTTSEVKAYIKQLKAAHPDGIFEDSFGEFSILLEDWRYVKIRYESDDYVLYDLPEGMVIFDVSPSRKKDSLEWVWSDRGWDLVFPNPKTVFQTDVLAGENINATIAESTQFPGPNPRTIFHYVIEISDKSAFDLYKKACAQAGYAETFSLNAREYTGTLVLHNKIRYTIKVKLDTLDRMSIQLSEYVLNR